MPKSVWNMHNNKDLSPPRLLTSIVLLLLLGAVNIFFFSNWQTACRRRHHPASMWESADSFFFNSSRLLAYERIENDVGWLVGRREQTNVEPPPPPRPHIIIYIQRGEERRHNRSFGQTTAVMLFLLLLTEWQKFFPPLSRAEQKLWLVYRLWGRPRSVHTQYEEEEEKEGRRRENTQWMWSINVCTCPLLIWKAIKRMSERREESQLAKYHSRPLPLVDKYKMNCELSPLASSSSPCFYMYTIQRITRHSFSSCLDPLCTQMHKPLDSKSFPPSSFSKVSWWNTTAAKSIHFDGKKKEISSICVSVCVCTLLILCCV